MNLQESGTAAFSHVLDVVKAFQTTFQLTREGHGQLGAFQQVRPDKQPDNYKSADM